jgi:hypothetical protein
MHWIEMPNLKTTELGFAVINGISIAAVCSVTPKNTMLPGDSVEID